MDPGPSRRTRVVNGCQACRARHVRCDENNPSCESCVKDGIECVRATNVRFRGFNKSGSESYSFPVDQTWVESDENLTYLDETAMVSSWYEDPDYIETDQPTAYVDGSRQGRIGGSMHSIGPLVNPESQDVEMASGGFSVQRSLDEAGNGTAKADARLHAVTPMQESHNRALLAATPRTESSATQSSPGSISSRSYSTVYPLSTATGPSNTILTQREAVLMRNFTNNMALWADITDRGRHFETDVPRRALYHPTLRYAIFAFSSRHMNRHRRGQESTEALEYYDKCLNLLIPTISNPENHVTEEVFAAVAILRQYEEMDSEDRRLHLTGTTRIVNSMRDWGFTPGLREASAWLCLRQDIYISMVQQSPLKTDLDAFLQSDIYTRDDDMAYAARVVVIVARILTGTAVEAAESRERILKESRTELEEWYESRPQTFNPTWVGPGNGEGRRIPEIWMLLPCNAFGLQYYHVAVILFTLSEPATQKSGYDGLRESRRRESVVRRHLRSIIGLANSNQGAENLLFMARHAISVWGGVLVDKADQQAVKAFLQHMQQTTSWNTEPMVASLQEQWDEF